jgi:adenosylhomocysteine nucleosidase
MRERAGVMLAIIAALPWEVNTLKHRRFGEGTSAHIENDVIVALSGIGAECTRAAAGRLLSQGATALLSWGCAAAIDGSLAAGRVILPQRVIAASGHVYTVSSGWHAKLCETLSRQCAVATGALIESNALVKTRAEKRALGQQSHAVATDMESAALAEFAQQHGVPFVAVRVIIDSASTELPAHVMELLDAEGGIRIRSVVQNVLFRPRDCLTMVQLARQFRVARQTLKQIGLPVLDASRIYLESLR